MFSSENHAGMLVELRVASPFRADELETLRRRHLEVVAGVGGEYVVAADFREAHVFPPAVAEGFVEMMTYVNPGLVRSAILVNDSAVFGLQAARAVQEAGSPNRRVFRASLEMQRWLGEVLTMPERIRLREFLEGPRPPLEVSGPEGSDERPQRGAS